MKTGIWIDKRQAHIIKVDRVASEVKTLTSDIETFNPKGGSRSNVPYGPVDTVSEQKYLERKIHQEKVFFDEVIAAVREEGRVLIMGPAQTKIGLKKRIEDHTEIDLKVIDCVAADSITENQMIEKVKKYFDIPTRVKGA